MKLAGHTPIWRADLEQLQPVKVAIRSDNKAIDSDGRLVSAQSHFSSESEAWEQLEKLLTHRYLAARNHIEYLEDKTRLSKEAMEKSRSELEILIARKQKTVTQGRMPSWKK